MIIKQYVRFTKLSSNSGPIKHYCEDNNLAQKNNCGIHTTIYTQTGNSRILNSLAIIPGFSALISRIGFFKFLCNELDNSPRDIILLRVSSFDLMLLPILIRLYSLRIKVIIVYHTIFDEKIMLISKLYHNICIKYCFGVAAPTQEILKFYNPSYSQKNFLFPNGVFIDNKRPLEGRIFTRDFLNLVFLASSNQRWHALEKIIQVTRTSGKLSINLHIIGNISGKNEKNVTFWGQKEGEELASLLANMDIGLGSFPPKDFILKETSALKHREYLRHGIPVFTGNYDNLADNKSKFLRVGELTAKNIIDFAYEVKKVSRNNVRENYLEEIDREKIFSRFLKSVRQKYRYESF